METDRELLELAAKAAGIGPLDFDYAEREGHGFYMGPRLPMPQGVLMAAMWTYWNPLTDDGQAFRLQVRFAMILELQTDEVECLAFDGPRGADLRQRVEGDVAAAYRRAIVRATAEIGKQMQKSNQRVDIAQQHAQNSS